MGENDRETFERLCAYVEQQMEDRRVPGVAVGVQYRGETYTAGFGVTNAEHPLPVTDETLFQIGSITKTFTTLAMMRLVEADQLDVQAPVRTYLPEFRVADEDASAQVTVWHLLTHMSGWDGDLFEDTGAGSDALPRYMAKMAELAQLAPLGAVWSYNNAGFYLAGYVIEQITGSSYEEAVKELVFDPLGLKRCYFNSGDVITHRFAVGHDASGPHAKVLRPWPLPRAANAAGGIICDVRELLRYARFQMGNGTVEQEGSDDSVQVLSQETMSSMHSPQATIHGEAAHISLSWFVTDIEGTRQLSHGGGTTGQVSILALYPEHQLALTVLTNAGEGGAITDGVRCWVLEHYLDLKDPKPEPIESAEKDLAAYVGFYTRPFADVELGMLNGRLVGQTIYKRGFPSQDVPPPPPPPPAALALCEEDRLLVVAGPGKGATADVIRTEDGAIGWLRMGRIYRRQERPSSP